MPDVLATRQEPLAQLGIALPRLRSVAVEASQPAVRFSLRGGDATAEMAGRAFGVELPRQACRASSAGSRTALWLGPDEWLLIASDEAPAVEPRTFGRTLAASLQTALAQVPHSLVDISHRQAALSLAGRDAATALNAGCPLDLSLAAFPAGMCTRTLFGKAEIVLWRTATDGFHIEVWRSFIGYVAGLLATACQDAASLARAR